MKQDAGSMTQVAELLLAGMHAAEAPNGHLACYDGFRARVAALKVKKKAK